MMSEQSPTIAAIQMVSGHRPAENLEQAAGLIAKAADAGADLAVLPENFGFMGLEEAHIRDHGEAADDGPMQAFLAEQAERNRLTLVGGTLPVRDEGSGKVYSACFVFGPDGERLGRYDKTHLFDVSLPDSEESYVESDHLLHGSGPVVLDTAIGRLGLAICYDLRFPEFFRQMSQVGVDLIAVPAAFTLTTGRAHWELLLRARAVENQVTVVAAGQGGHHSNGRDTYGHSMIVGPWGEVSAVYGYGQGMALAGFDLDAQLEMRRQFPVLAHRRL